MARNLFSFIPRNEPSLNIIPIIKFHCRSFGLSQKVHDEWVFKPLKYVIKPSKGLSKEERKRKIIRLQWENAALFGPLLKSAPEKKKTKMGAIKLSSEILNLRETQNEMNVKSYCKPEPNVESGMLNNDSNVYNKRDAIIDFPMMNPWTINESRMPYKNVINQSIIDDIKSYPSVTRILNETMSEKSKMALENWKTSMIEQLGEEGFALYQANLFKLGRNLHKNIAEFMEGKDEQSLSILPENEGHWRSLAKVFPQLNDAILIEHSLYHPYLKYKGVVDCVAVYRNKLLVIDWKTSKKIKPSIYSIFDNPIQVVAYLGALNSDESLNLKVDSAAVIVAYENGSPAHIHLLNRNMCLKFWKRWLIRLDQYLSKSST